MVIIWWWYAADCTPGLNIRKAYIFAAPKVPCHFWSGGPQSTGARWIPNNFVGHGRIMGRRDERLRFWPGATWCHHGKRMKRISCHDLNNGENMTVFSPKKTMVWNFQSRRALFFLKKAWKAMPSRQKKLKSLWVIFILYFWKPEQSSAYSVGSGLRGPLDFHYVFLRFWWRSGWGIYVVTTNVTVGPTPKEWTETPCYSKPPRIMEFVKKWL